MNAAFERARATLEYYILENPNVTDRQEIEYAFADLEQAIREIVREEIAAIKEEK